MTPFILERPSGGVPVLVHVPHAGTWIPDGVRDDIQLDDGQLQRELLLMTDHATDTLSDGMVDLGATRFVNRVSRLVVDPERFIEGSEPMEASGMGAVYTQTAHGDVLRRVSDMRRRELLDRWFVPYATAMAAAVDEMLAEHGRCTIVDLHSYPSDVLPYELDPVQPRPPVCIGVDGFHTSARLRGTVVAACEQHDLAWATDRPFAGTYVPLGVYRTDARVASVMVEIRRDTYLDEASATPHDGFSVIRQFCEDVVVAVAAH